MWSVWSARCLQNEVMNPKQEVVGLLFFKSQHCSLKGSKNIYIFSIIKQIKTLLCINISSVSTPTSKSGMYYNMTCFQAHHTQRPPAGRRL